MPRILKSLIAVAAIFALTAIGICAARCYFTLAALTSAIDADAGQLQLVTQHLDSTLTDLDRTIQIAAGAINQARQIERDNRNEIRAINQQTLATLQHVDALLMNVDVTQKQAGAAIADTSAAIVPTLSQVREDLAELQPAIKQMVPLLQQGTVIAGNLNQATADVEHEIHKLVYPPPRKWYQKYLLDPLKTAAHLITIPLGHL